MRLAIAVFLVGLFFVQDAFAQMRAREPGEPRLKRIELKLTEQERQIILDALNSRIEGSPLQAGLPTIDGTIHQLSNNKPLYLNECAAINGVLLTAGNEAAAELAKKVQAQCAK